MEVKVSQQGVVDGCNGVRGDDVRDGVGKWSTGSRGSVDEGSLEDGVRAGQYLEVKVFHQVCGLIGECAQAEGGFVEDGDSSSRAGSYSFFDARLSISA